MNFNTPKCYFCIWFRCINKWNVFWLIVWRAGIIIHYFLFFKITKCRKKIHALKKPFKLHFFKFRSMNILLDFGPRTFTILLHKWFIPDLKWKITAFTCSVVCCAISINSNIAIYCKFNKTRCIVIHQSASQSDHFSRALVIIIQC